MSEISMDPMVARFLELIKETREKKKMTREQLAAKAKVHKTTIGLLERKRRIPTLQIANQIAKALGLSLSKMVKKAE
ncbi:helix-turn-helix domain-containing protein [bacterium]|nr:helix-turn-helix domain-containing protein [bacterium]